MNIIERKELIDLILLDNLIIQLNLKMIEKDHYENMNGKNGIQQSLYSISKKQVKDLQERIEILETKLKINS